MSGHRRSRRFADYQITNVEILFTGTYDECDALEEGYITQYDTFYKGLNMTNRGKGRNLSSKFNTFGYKFSESSRKKMSEKSKARTDRKTGHKHSDEVKRHWSDIRRGKVWGPIKVDVQTLLSQWGEFAPSLADMESMVVYRDDKVWFKNGREFSYPKGKLSLFKRLKSVEYGVTPEAIKRIIVDEQLV